MNSDGQKLPITVKGLVGRKAVVIDKITAHPPNLTKFFIFISSKSFESCTIDIEEGIVHVIFFTMWVRMERSTLR